ncbi:hypothetical protein [Paenilisteria rocourtiae]|uniref:Uncharacterized protein n=1 Tax=Listeria rocourtiae TaxID=647910 RepID=A0A4R6ZP09_9LIST|nr:hypothetical protein [Listeria rocourtiae]EUJ51224.1 hypothetical protein PROCOU_03979 [Listeria rocourtiae FSL F6-920]MBC1434217.1 hypothetical protein [Listeria rocourtiae]MBC1603742.1 hypothetical protein [Listeria rocourtiae]TDR54102.1 hypothetical protein DFP96_103201 [Listeria rocourtiae]
MFETFIQMAFGPEYISLYVTFFMTMAVLRYWPVLAMVKPTMILHMKHLCITPLPVIPWKPAEVYRANFIIVWLVQAITRFSNTDDAYSLSFS